MITVDQILESFENEFGYDVESIHNPDEVNEIIDSCVGIDRGVSETIFSHFQNIYDRERIDKQSHFLKFPAKSNLRTNNLIPMPLDIKSSLELFYDVEKRILLTYPESHEKSFNFLLELHGVKMHGNDNTSGSNRLKFSEMDILSTLVSSANSNNELIASISAIQISAKCILVGNSEGIIFIYLPTYEISSKLQLTQSTGKNPIAVTAIGINSREDRVVAGYSNGYLVLWDLVKSSMLKHIQDIHSSPISFVYFLDKEPLIDLTSLSSTAKPVPTSFPSDKLDASSGRHSEDMYVVSVDATGQAYRSHITKALWSPYLSEPVCLLDGSAGPVLDIRLLSSLIASGAVASLPWKLSQDLLGPSPARPAYPQGSTGALPF